MKKIQLYPILIIVCLISIALLICIFACSNGNGQTGAAAPIRITGSYRKDGQAPKELTNETLIDNAGIHTVVISGQFTSDIPQNMVLTLLLDNIKVSIRINGSEVYHYGGEGTTTTFSKTAGNTWGFYVSPGITTTDEVEITLENIYAGSVTNVFDKFLHSMSYGHGFELYQTMAREKSLSMLLGFFIFAAGIIAFLFFVVARIFKAPNIERGMALACVTIVGGIWIFIDGGYPYTSLLFDNPLLFNAIDVLQIFVISVVLVIFTGTCLENKTTKKIARIVAESALILLTLAVLVQLIGLYDLYEIQSWAIAIGFFVSLASVVLLGYEALMLKHRQALYILLSWLPLFVSGFFEVLNYYVRFMPERTTIKYGFTLSVLLQFAQLVHIIRENVIRTQNAAHLEYELLQSRMAVMFSQIQPHFLFNTLNDIRFLYRESPVQAEEVLVSFTRYLRGNMESLNHSDLIPFEQELHHIQNYVSIEKIRFGNRLEVDFEISCTQLFIPVLTVQPLVENAIRHGVTKKRDGGTVTIRTCEDAHSYIIEVLDDGVGFDSLAPLEDDGKTHTGINNVRMRLQSMCGGSLVITSRVGEGTASQIRIPKEWKK